MLDYDNLDDLERYALAADTAARRQLLAVSAPEAMAVKPGQAFLAGLFALENNDLAAARDQVQRLKSLAPHSDYCRRLEALVALRSWPEDPAVTCTYLKESCGLNLNAPPPPPAAAAAASEGQQVAASSQPSEKSQPAGAQQGADPSVLDPSLYSDRSILRKAVQMSRGSVAGATALPNLLSRAGMAAALSCEEEYDLGLTLDERLQLAGLGHTYSDSVSGTEQVLVRELLSGNSLLTRLAVEAAAAERGAAFVSLLPYMTAEQLDELVALLPPAAAEGTYLLASAVRKMYGTRGAVSGVAAAVDAADGGSATATSNLTPLLTAAEAAAICRRVLQLCDRLRARRAAAGEEVVPEQLAWLEARALLPLAEAAVQRAVAADAAAAAAAVAVAETAGGDAAAAAARLAVVEAAAEAEQLLARLLGCLEAQGGLLSATGHHHTDSRLLAMTTPRPGASPPPSAKLGPALPPLRPNTAALVRKMLEALLQVSPNPRALFAAEGALAGKLDPAVQARLLSEAMLTRGPPPSSRGCTHAGAAAAATAIPAAAAAASREDVDWAAAYRDSGGELALLAEVAELEVSGPAEAAGEGGCWARCWEAPGEDVVLIVSHKAVQRISVLVYDIATEAYYREKGQEVGMDIDLEGLGPTIQLEIDLPPGLQPLQRCRRLVPLPQLKGRRGVWVVEVQGGGLQSRALLRRGGLAAVVRCSPAGMALTLFREDGSPVAEPRVWVDGRVYGPAPAVQGTDPAAAAGGGSAAAAPAAPAAAAAAAAAAREVLVPYRADQACTVAAVLVDGADGFASLMSLQHVTEEYDFTCGMQLEPESVAAGGRGGTAPLLLQPCLTISGWGAPLELLQDVSLTVEVKNFDSVIGDAGGEGGARRQVFHRGWNPGDGLQAAVVQVRLPDRPSAVTAVLTARLRRMARGSDGEPDYKTFRVARTWELNQSDLLAEEIRDLHLTRGSAGNYLLRLLGKAGEPHPGVQVVVALTHTFSAQLEPHLPATETAPPAGGGAGGAFDEDEDQLVIRQALITDANGSIDLGPLNGITAVAASVEILEPAASSSTRGFSNAKRWRRRYCWPLPWHGPVGEPLPAGSGRGGGGSSAIQHLSVRALAATSGASRDDGRLQCSIPFLLSETMASGGGNGAASSTAAADDEGPLGQQQELRRRLGLTLVSLAAAAAFPSTGVQACAPPAALSARLPAIIPANPDLWEVCERLDEQHVTVRRGQIQVLGLPPGVYGLYVSRLDLVVTILVYGGTVVGPADLMAAAAAPPAAVTPPTGAEGTTDAYITGGGDRAAAANNTAGAGAGGSFVLYRGLVAPLSEPRTLKITQLRASVGDGVVARLEGSEEQLGAAVVVAVLTRFEAHKSGRAMLHTGGGAPPTLLGRATLSLRSGVAFGVPPPASYQSGRRQSDEVRYVLERRRLVAEGRVRPMPALVDRPSLLVQPWKVRETATSSRTARQGEAFTCEANQQDMREMPSADSPRAYTSAAYAAPMMLHGSNQVDMLAYEGDPYRRSGRGGGPRMLREKQRPAAAAGTLGLAFCPPAVVLANVPVGRDGVVHLTAEQLAAAVARAVAPTGVRMSATDPWVSAGHRLVRLIAYTAPAGIAAADFGTYAYCEERVAVEGAPAPSWTDPRVTTALQRPFPAGSACLDLRSCHALQPGSDLVIADAATAKLQLYGTVSKVWNLYGSLLSFAAQNPDVIPYCRDDDGAASLWSQFSCVGGWFGLSGSAKLECYSQLACRELAFFCYCHDPVFFRSALLPRLRQRLPSSRNCLDCWMAGLRGRELVEMWGTPHRYAKLTPLERILLAWEEDLLMRTQQSSSSSSPSSSAAAMSSAAAGPPPAGGGAGGSAAAADAAAVAPTPHLARLAADMRARIRRGLTVLSNGAAASLAELKRQRFEIALNGPGDDDESQQQRSDPLTKLSELAAFDDEKGDHAPTALPPPPWPPQSLTGLRICAKLAVRHVRSRNAADQQLREFAAARQQQAYRAPPATQEWAEAGWFRRPPSEQLDPNSISPESEFWADLAEHLSRGGRLGPCSGSTTVPESGAVPPSAAAAATNDAAAAAAAAAGRGLAFLPRSLAAGGWSFSDALLATAVVGVPWEEAAPLSVSQGTRLILTATAPTIAYVRQTAAVPPPPAPTSAAAATAAESGSDVVLDTRQQHPQQQQPAAGGSGGSILVIQRLLDPNLDPNEMRGAPLAAACGDGDGDGHEGEKDEMEVEVEVPPQDCDGVEVPPGSPLVYGRLYCYSVVASNIGASGARMDVTVQAPQGAVALGGRPALWVHSTEVPAYGAIKLPLYYFYFPRPAGGSDGDSAAAGSAAAGSAAEAAGNDAASWYDTFPAAATARGQVLAVALVQSSRVQVLPSLPATSSSDLAGTAVGSWSWPRIAALPANPAADEMRLRFLEEGDLAGVDLGLMMWRCHEDAAFWRSAVAALRKRREWNQELWSYAVLHRDEQALRELLPSLEPLVTRLGVEAPATGSLSAASPPDAQHSSGALHESAAATTIWACADRFPHLEYWPLVNPRAHPLGGQRATLNEALELSWRHLLARMAAVAAAGHAQSTEDLLAAAYYLALQDRPMEAGVLVARLERNAGGVGGERALQLSYLRAWLVLADPSSSAEELRSWAAVLRQGIQKQAAGGVVPPPTAVQDSEQQEGGSTAGAAAAAVGLISEPRWQSRLVAMVAALEEVAAAAAAHAGEGQAAAGGVPAASEGAVEGGGGGGGVSKLAAPELLLYTSPDGPRGAVVLESAGVQKVTLAAHFMDLELLFSVSPFDTTLTSSGSYGGTTGGAGSSSSSSSSAAKTTTAAAGGCGKFSLLRPAWSTTLDLQEFTAKAAQLLAGDDTIEIRAGLRVLSPQQPGGAVSKLLIKPQILVQKQPAALSEPVSSATALSSRRGSNGAVSGGVIMLEAFVARDEGVMGSGAALDPLHRSLACYHCDMRVMVRKEQFVVAVTNIESGAPVSGAYVKVYVQKDGGGSAAALFHKDGYTDRRGIMDFWTLTMKPEGKIRSVALLVSHPELGSTVLHSDPPLH